MEHLLEPEDQKDSSFQELMEDERGQGFGVVLALGALASAAALAS